MTFIIIMTMVIYFILIAWTWHSLGTIEKAKKIGIILIGMILMYVVTLIVFQMTKGGINYENVEMQKSVQNWLVSIFTAVNGIIVMPQIGKMLDKTKEEEMTKEVFKKKVIILAIVFILCLIFEVGYIKDTQEGILRMYAARK